LSRDDKANPDQRVDSTIFGVSSSIIGTVILISPILFTLLVYPDSFILSWNEGRGGFLFAMAFIAAELVGLKQPISKRKLLVVAGLAILTITYFIALPYGLQDYIRNGKDIYNVSLTDSWMWMWDFILMAIFVASSLVLFFGKKWYKIASAGAIYLGGTALILALDAFFPFDSLGPLQIVVPIYLQIDQTILNFLDAFVTNLGPESVNNSLQPAMARDNLLVLNGLHGPFALQVFWPSAGVHSMVIYTLVMLALLLKMDIPLGRKLIYFAAGTLGTVATNLVRIVSLSLYALVVTTNVQQWEAFHSVAGEIMFLPWLGVYLSVVIYIENKLLRRLRAGLTSAATSDRSVQ
jgi:thaumarchaeosortase